MSFLEERTGAEKLGGILVIIAIGLLLRVAWTVGGVSEWFTPSQAVVEAQIERELANDPQMGGLYTAMRDHFPGDYAALKSTLAATARETGEEAQVFNVGRTFLVAFMNRNAVHFGAAPEAELFAARDEAIRTIDILAEQDDALCAHFGTTGLQAGDKPSTRARAQLGRAVDAQMAALVAGKQTPVDRAEVTDADFAAYYDGLVGRGLTVAEIEILAQGGPVLMGQPLALQCKLNRAVYHALADMPPDISARLSSRILVPVE